MGEGECGGSGGKVFHRPHFTTFDSVVTLNETAILAVFLRVFGLKTALFHHKSDFSCHFGSF